MSYRLYNRVGSGGAVVEMALALAEAPVGLIELDSKPGTPLPRSFREINPWGQVPTLILPDGTLMTECAAILAHLAAAHPEAALAPAPGTSDHARFLRWLVFISLNVYEPLQRTAYTGRFTTDPSSEDAVREAAASRCAEALVVLEAQIEEQTNKGPFLLGPSMTLVDLYAAMLLVWIGRKPWAEPVGPRLRALVEQVRAHPVVAPVWRRHLG